MIGLIHIKKEQTKKMIELPYIITIEKELPKLKIFPWIWKKKEQKTIILKLFIEESSIELVEETYGSEGEIDQDSCMIKIYGYDKYYNILLTYEELVGFLNTKTESQVGFKIPKKTKRTKRKINDNI